MHPWLKERLRVLEEGDEERRVRGREYYGRNREVLNVRRRYRDRVRRKALYDSFGGVCCLCGGVDDLNFHHFGGGWSHRNVFRVGHIERFRCLVVVLCRGCHLTWHRVGRWVGVRWM